MEPNTIHTCDALTGLRLLPDESVDCIVTSPPYWQMRDYGIGSIVWPDGWSGQLGLEPTREEFIAHLCMIFDECRRVLKPSGTLWVNLGDSYSKPYKYNRRQDPQVEREFEEQRLPYRHQGRYGASPYSIQVALQYSEQVR